MVDGSAIFLGEGPAAEAGGGHPITSNDTALGVETLPLDTTIGPSVPSPGTVTVSWVSESIVPPAVPSPNFTPHVFRKPNPVMTTVSPGLPLVTLIPVIASGIVKFAPLRAVPAMVVTAIFPVNAPGGTVAFTWVALTGMMLEASTPLNVTAMGPVRFVPLIVTTVPATPLGGVKLPTVGGRITVKLPTLVPVPASVVTETLFVVAVAGTVTVIVESSSTESVVAATAPKMQALAGELADGCLTPSITTPAFVRYTRENVGKGIDIGCTIVASIGEDRDEGRDGAREIAGMYLANKVQNIKGAADTLLDLAGLEQEEIRPIAEAMERGGRLAAKELVTDAILDKCKPIAGTPSDCIEAIEEYRDAGCTHVMLELWGTKRHEQLRLFGEKVVPQFR